MPTVKYRLFCFDTNLQVKYSRLNSSQQMVGVDTICLSIFITIYMFFKKCIDHMLTPSYIHTQDIIYNIYILGDLKKTDCHHDRTHHIAENYFSYQCILIRTSILEAKCYDVIIRTQIQISQNLLKEPFLLLFICFGGGGYIHTYLIVLVSLFNIVNHFFKDKMG